MDFYQNYSLVLVLNDFYLILNEEYYIGVGTDIQRYQLGEEEIEEIIAEKDFIEREFGKPIQDEDKHELARSFLDLMDRVSKIFSSPVILET